MSRPLTRPRRGIALMVAILGIVVVGALVATAYFSATQEHRLGRNTLVAQRAFAIAEYGLSSEVGNFDRGRYLFGSPRYMAPGAVDDKPVYVAQGDTARVKITRLNENTFWLVSEGSASMGDARLKSTQRTNAVVRIAYPSVNVRGGFTTAGRLKINGTGKIYGNDLMDTGRSEFRNLDQWAACDAIPSQNLAGVSVTNAADVSGKLENIVGTPAIQPELVAGDTLTYVKYGSETWNSLRTNADKMYSNGTATVLPNGGTVTYPLIPASPGFPSGTATTCNYADPRNFGEPWRQGMGYVAGCTDYFPIIYHEGSLHLQGGRGQGILLINGDFSMNGGFEWYGLIIVSGDVLKANGDANIFGALMAKSTSADGFGTNDWSEVVGTQNVFFNRCAVESSLRGSAILVPVRQRGWAQFF